jgi:hypothetical protein
MKIKNVLGDFEVNEWVADSFTATLDDGSVFKCDYDLSPFLNTLSGQIAAVQKKILDSAKYESRGKPDMEARKRLYELVVEMMREDHMNYLSLAREIIEREIEQYIEFKLEQFSAEVFLKTFLESQGRVKLHFSIHPHESSDLKRLMLKHHSQTDKERFGFMHGGDRRSRHDWNKEGELERYARKVNEVTPLCECIAKFHKENADDDSWMSMLKMSSKFQELSKDYSQVNNNFLRRAADSGLDAKERQPQGLALELARRELGLPDYSYETLIKYYREGNEYLRSETISASLQENAVYNQSQADSVVQVSV